MPTHLQASIYKRLNVVDGLMHSYIAGNFSVNHTVIIINSDKVKLMRKIALLLTTFLVASCSVMEVKVDEPIDNKKVGLIYEIDYEPKLCQKHVGLTVFNNYTKEYPLSSDLEKVIQDGYLNGIISTGNFATLIESAPYLYDYMTFSNWDGSMTINDEGKRKIIEIGQKYDLDYLLVSMYLPKSRPPKNGEEVQCYGFYLNTGGNYNVPLFPLVGAFAFDTNTGEKVGRIRILNNAITVKNPEDHKNITEEEIEYYVQMNGKFAEKSIIDFVRISRGEQVNPVPKSRKK